jgi:acid phosphatase family membrane protein YuiD
MHAAASFCSVLTLCVTNTTKMVVGRIRPGAHTIVKRRFNLRSLERNNAMPSGDSAQAALWTTLLVLNFGNPLPW